MPCEYGCATENIDQRCTNCGHPKRHHSHNHPHQCIGEYKPGDLSPVRQCFCAGFTTDTTLVAYGGGMYVENMGT